MGYVALLLCLMISIEDIRRRFLFRDFFLKKKVSFYRAPISFPDANPKSLPSLSCTIWDSLYLSLSLLCHRPSSLVDSVCGGQSQTRIVKMRLWRRKSDLFWIFHPIPPLTFRRQRLDKNDLHLGGVSLYAKREKERESQ